MSVQTALDNIDLRPTARWGHTEYSLGYHAEYLAKRTGLAKDAPPFMRRAQDLFAFDFLWNTNDGLVNWDKVRADIDRTFARLADSKGAIVAVGNHLPPNIPGEMLDRYFDYLLPRLPR